MTLPLRPPPSLSAAAQPYVPTPLPRPGPDHALAARAFSGQSVQAPGPCRDRDLRERELLGMAMASPHGLAALRDLSPEEFAIPVNQYVARAIGDVADSGRRPDSGTVTAELRTRGQLPVELDPLPDRRPPGLQGRPGVDPRTTGLGAWQTLALAPEQRAPELAREIRSLHRQDTCLEVVHTALQQYRQGLVLDGRDGLEADRLDEVTKELADKLTALPKELHPEWGHDTDRSVATWVSTPTARTPKPEALDLPTPPRLSAAGQRALRTPRPAR